MHRKRSRGQFSRNCQLRYHVTIYYSLILTDEKTFPLTCCPNGEVIKFSHSRPLENTARLCKCTEKNPILTNKHCAVERVEINRKRLQRTAVTHCVRFYDESGRYRCWLGSEKWRAKFHISRRRLARVPADQSRRKDAPVAHTCREACENYFNYYTASNWVKVLRPTRHKV